MKDLSCQLHSLNMPKSQVDIRVTPQASSTNGCDKVEIYFAPNQGEKMVPIRQCASGGELSRILLAIKVLLAGKKNIPLLIFD